MLLHVRHLGNTGGIWVISLLTKYNFIKHDEIRVPTLNIPKGL